MYCCTMPVVGLGMPPTAAIAFAVTLELPPALAEFDDGEFE